MAKLIDPTKLISLADAAREFKFHGEHLRQLCAIGRLEGWFVGNTWLTTRENVEAYLASRKRVTRPRKSTPQLRNSHAGPGRSDVVFHPRAAGGRHRQDGSR